MADELNEEELTSMAASIRTNRRRQGVTASHMDVSAISPKKVIHKKTPSQRKRLVDIVKKTFLLGNLEEVQSKEIVDAMFLKTVKKDEVIIGQGETGNYCYVIDKGQFDAIICEDGVSKKTGSYSDSGCFGELALMYNTTRAATIKATTDGILWGLDRDTFRGIILTSTAERRQHIETTLAKVNILQELTQNELLNLADALTIEYYENKAIILQQGTPGSDMYFILEGQVRIYITNSDKKEKEINILSKNEYFGELAILNKQERKASASAVGQTMLAKLSVQSFERMLGPCIDILKRNIANYEKRLKEVENKPV